MQKILLLFALALVGCSAGVQEGVDMETLTITSSAFSHNEKIPVRYTCDGDDVNPGLDISGIPDGTKSMALIVDDPDAPGKTWVHWVVWNIPPGGIAEDSIPGMEGMNDFKKSGYGGPCPPSGEHRYFFKIYALDSALDIPPSSTKIDVENAMEGHVLAKGELIGLYSRIRVR